MTMTLEHLKKNSRILEGNLAEARKYAIMAHETKAQDRALADWYLQMAAKHMEFNVAGLPIVDRMESELTAQEKEAGPGIDMIYREKRADWAKESAEVSAMISCYSK